MCDGNASGITLRAAVCERLLHNVYRKAEGPSIMKQTAMSVIVTLVTLALCSAVIAETRTRYVVTDYRGSPVVVVGERGLVLNRIEYSPYGEGRQVKRDFAPEYIGFAGGLRIGEHLTYMLAMDGRPYSPLMQRYLSPDFADPGEAASRQFMSYLYENNSPLRYRNLRERAKARQGLGRVGGLPMPALPEMWSSSAYGVKAGIVTPEALGEAGVPLPEWLNKSGSVSR